MGPCLLRRELDGCGVVNDGDGVSVGRLRRLDVVRDARRTEFARNADALPERAHLAGWCQCLGMTSL